MDLFGSLELGLQEEAEHSAAGVDSVVGESHGMSFRSFMNVLYRNDSRFECVALEAVILARVRGELYGEHVNHAHMSALRRCKL